MTFHDVSEKLQHGGTFLFTARSAEFGEDAGKQKAAGICKELGIETLIVIGGDGSFKGARDLSKYGVILLVFRARSIWISLTLSIRLVLTLQ